MRPAVLDTFRMMLYQDVIGIVASLESAGVLSWIDGGWGIDALVGYQTRDHDDLDVVIPIERAETAMATLAALGYAMLLDERPTRFVMGTLDDRRVDFHLVTFDVEGGGIKQLQDGSSWRYPPSGFAGKGRLGTFPMHCLTTEVQVLCHLGYEPDATDREDMHVLSQRFHLTLTPPYRGVREIDEQCDRPTKI